MSQQEDRKSLPRRSISQERVENVSDILGSWGPFQRQLFMLLTLIYFASPFNNASLFYYVIKSDLWCEQADGTKIAIASDKCSFSQLNTCLSWGHNTTRNTITKEWDLVCERYWLRSLALSAYQIGYLFSGLLVGYISDKYGRKLALVYSLIGEIICSIGLYFSSSVYMFIGFRVLSAIGGLGRYLASLILLVESVEPRFRGKMVVCFDWVWIFVNYLMLLVTYFVPNFRYIYLGMAIFQIFCLFLMIKVPESPRWQLVSGRSDQAEKTLRKYAVATGRVEEAVFSAKLAKLHEYLVTKEDEGENPASKMNIIDLWRQPKLLKYCLALYALWFLRGFVGHGMHYVTLDLSGNIFLNSAIFGIFGSTATILLAWKIETIPRRSFLIVFLILTATFLFAAIPFAESPDHVIPRTIIICGESVVSSALGLMLYVYSPELFPTSIRHLGVGTCSVAGRIATISAPFVAQMSASTSLQMTFGIFAIFGLVGAATAFFLPETKGKEIPDTVEDMIEMNMVDEENKKTGVGLKSTQ